MLLHDKKIIARQKNVGQQKKFVAQQFFFLKAPYPKLRLYKAF